MENDVTANDSKVITVTEDAMQKVKNRIWALSEETSLTTSEKDKSITTIKIQKNIKPKKVPQRQLEECCLATCLYELIVVVQSLSHIQLFVTPWTTAGQPPLSFTVSQSLLKLMSTESVMLLVFLW